MITSNENRELYVMAVIIVTNYIMASLNLNTLQFVTLECTVVQICCTSSTETKNLVFKSILVITAL